MRVYKCLSKQTYSLNIYQIVPIRDQDKYDIMQWRNEQIYHLRQSNPLEKESQDQYFDTVITELFEKEKPDQILFSYLENGICIGYGGLVRINWVNKNAEISFIMNTKLEEMHFNKHWKNFLSLIETLAFETLSFHKIYTYAYNIRPKLFHILTECEYRNEAILHEHVFIDSVYEDVLIHAKFKKSN